MNILVFNCGSSSLSYRMIEFNSSSGKTIGFGKAHRVNVTGPYASYFEHNILGCHDKVDIPLPDHQTAAYYILRYLKENGVHFDIIGHRFVHGGNLFQQAAIINPANLEKLKTCLNLAPIHNPNSFSVIQLCRKLEPQIPQFVFFDTAFHSPLPHKARRYLLPKELSEKHGYQKFGFHGLSYTYISKTVRQILEPSLGIGKMIICHLGTGGSSLVALNNGSPIDTSMGFSPLPGLVMSTRTGDLDPLLPLHIVERFKCTPEDLEFQLNKQGGVLGLSHFSSDLRDIEERIKTVSSHDAQLTFNIFTHRIKEYIGAYSLLLGGLDCLVFTDDIGAQDWKLRQVVCEDLSWLGIELEAKKYFNSSKDHFNIISAPTSRVIVIAMATDEEEVIAQEGWRLFSEVQC